MDHESLRTIAELVKHQLENDPNVESVGEEFVEAFAESTTAGRISDMELEMFDDEQDVSAGVDSSSAFYGTPKLSPVYNMLHDMDECICYLRDVNELR